MSYELMAVITAYFDLLDPVELMVLQIAIVFGSEAKVSHIEIEIKALKELGGEGGRLKEREAREEREER
jgi:hypothetical protein